MLGQHFRDIFLTLTVYNIPSSSVLPPKTGQYSRSVLTGSQNLIFPFFLGNRFNILFTSFMRGNSNKFLTLPACSEISKTKTSETCSKVCLIHSQPKHRINTFFLLFFPLSYSSHALKTHILAFREAKHLFRLR